MKWWLLAIPHLLIVAAFTGSTWTWRMGTRDWSGDVEGWTTDAGDRTTDFGPGGGLTLLGLLVLIAAVILLFTGRYRRPLFELIMGINRWIYRVIVYTVLLRDEYPPFRLDQGPADPAIETAPGAQPADRQ